MPLLNVKHERNLPLRKDLSKVNYVDSRQSRNTIMSLDISKISGMSMIYDPGMPILEEDEGRLLEGNRYTNRSSKRSQVGGGSKFDSNCLKLPMLPKVTSGSNRRIANLS